jgi:hypothetical protein
MEQYFQDSAIHSERTASVLALHVMLAEEQKFRFPFALRYLRVNGKRLTFVLSEISPAFAW